MSNIFSVYVVGAVVNLVLAIVWWPDIVMVIILLMFATSFILLAHNEVDSEW